MRFNRLMLGVLAAFLGFIGWRVALYAPAPEPGSPQANDGSLVKVELSWDGEPGVGNTVTLSAQVTSEISAADVNLRWVVPDGVTAIGAREERLGPIAPGQTLTAKHQVTIDREGVFKLVAGASVTLADGSAFGDSDRVYAIVGGPNDAYMSREGPRLISTREPLIAPDIRIDESSVHPDGGFWVRGQFKFSKYYVTASGVQGPYIVPGRRVIVEIWEEDPVSDDFEGSVYTDDLGHFEYYVPNNDDGILGGDKEIYIEVWAETPGGYVTDQSYHDDRYLCYSQTVGGGHDIDFGEVTPSDFDPMFNIADAALTIHDYAAQFRSAPAQVHFQYEPGFGEDETYWDRYYEEITLNDTDDDAYDNAIIYHEYGHFLSQTYMCNESPGGKHSPYRHLNSKLAWDEGWGDYLSSAARADEYYLDWNWETEGWFAKWNLETFSTPKGMNIEGAVAATLWDLYDTSIITETFDRLALGMDEIWDTFDEGMEGDDTCNLHTFYDAWGDRGYARDSDFTAIFANYNMEMLQGDQAVPAGGPDAVPPRVDAAAAKYSGALAALTAIGALRAPGPFDTPDTLFVDEAPWRGVLFLVDGTESMREEIAAVKSIVQTRIDDLDAEPEACQYAVETFADNWHNTPVVNDFFPDLVNPSIAGISVAGGGDLAEGSLHAVLDGTRYRQGYNVWLFTDGPAKELLFGREGAIPDGSDSASLGWVHVLVERLQQRSITPYMFIFGQCDDPNSAMGAEAMDLQSCIEPYLQTAAGTGGQFMFLDTSQVGNATEVVRALMKDNASAARYNYTVNATDYTYSWDDIPYDWVDEASVGGTLTSVGDTPVQVALPWFFTFHGQSYDHIYLNRPGYVTFANYATNESNTSIPTTATPNNAIYGFWDAIDNRYTGAAGAPDALMGVYTYYDVSNHQFVIEYSLNYHVNNSANIETFQIILEGNNLGLNTDDTVRVQYKTVSDDSSLTLGVENAAGTVATRVAYDDPGFLWAGRAIRFSPIAPGQRVHTVPVDPYMESVSFFVNSYLGSVTPSIYRPSGTLVNTTDPDVTYYAVGPSRYYRIADPADGDWTVRVGGTGTYYFISSTVTDLVAQFVGSRTMTMGSNNIVVDLGTALGTPPAFALVNSQGTAVAHLTLYDDGAHGDGAPDDGRYGGTYTPAATAAGTFFLQVDGVVSVHNTPFRRLDRTPLTFQRMSVTGASQTQYVRPGDTKTYRFGLRNSDTLTRTFDVTIQSRLDWISPQYRTVTLGPGDYTLVQITFQVPTHANNVTDEMVMTAESAGMAASGTVITTVRHATGEIRLETRPASIETGGDRSVITALVYDQDGWDVPDGTQVTFQTTLGTLSPITGTTAGGWVTTTLTSGTSTGSATLLARTGTVTQAVTIEFRPPAPYTLTLETGTSQLPPNGTATTPLTVHVYDRRGNPVPNGTTVVFAVDGDDLQWGGINGQEIYTATTTSGVATATYQAGLLRGTAHIRAHVPSGGPAGTGEATASGLVAWTTIRLSYSYSIFLPAALRNAP